MALRLATLLCMALGFTGCLSLDNEIFGDETPEVVEKEFVVVAAPNGVTLEGSLYPSDTALEVIAHDEQAFSVVGENGKPLLIPKIDIESGRFAHAWTAWDKANERWTFRDPPDASWLVRYFHWTQTFLARAWPFALTFLLISIYLFVAAVGAGDSESSGLEIFWPTLIMLSPLLLIGSCQGNNYYGLYAWSSRQQVPHFAVTAEGYFYPSPASFVAITHTISYDLGLILWIPAFVALHLILVFAAPFFVRGVVYCYYRGFVLERWVTMSEDKRKMEVLPAIRSDAVVGRTRWKSRLLRIFGISEREEHERRVGLYQDATEVIRAEIEYLTTKASIDRVQVSVAIDALRELNRLIEESIKFRQLSAEYDEREERASRRKETAAERVLREAKEESERELRQQLSRFLVDKQKAELIAEVIGILMRDAGEDEGAQERVRGIQEAIEHGGGGRV